MSLTIAQAEESLKRFTIHARWGEEERRVYVQTILEVCGWMEPLRFDQACQELQKHWRASQHPKPGHLIDAYNRLAEKQGWNNKKDDSKKCGSCNGIGLVYSWVRRVSTDQEFEAVGPCPLCRHTSDLKPDLEDIEGPAQEQRLQAAITPHGARFMLSIIEQFNWNIGEERLKFLIEKSAEDKDEQEAEVESSQNFAAFLGETHPAVAHIPEEKRKALNEEAERLDIPF